MLLSPFWHLAPTLSYSKSLAITPAPLPNSRVQASIARTNVYTDPEAIHNGAGSVSLGVGTQAAISAGAFSASALSVSFSCPTGNCTFERPYSSVGFCSSCSDISTELRRINYTYVVENPELPGGHANASTLNYTLSSGLYVTPVDDGSVFALGGYSAAEYSRLPMTVIEANLQATDPAILCF